MSENDNEGVLEIRNRYKQLRWEQRKIIVEYLLGTGGCHHHVLMDRIGIFAFQDAATPRDSYRLMNPTDIDLPMVPMDDVKIRQLADRLAQALA